MLWNMALAIRDEPDGPDEPESVPVRNISILYCILPSALQSQLPTFSSFRQMVRIGPRRRSFVSRHGPTTGENLGPRMVTDGLTASSSNEKAALNQSWQFSGQRQGKTRELLASSETSDSSTPGVLLSSHQTLHTPLQIQESITGIEWDTIVTAIILLSKACQRAQQANSRPENTRALVVDANKWLLRSLPNDITPHELAEIEEALPPMLKDLDKNDRRSGNRRLERRLDKRSWLRRVIAFTILQASVLIALLIPYLIFLFNLCYRLERNHRLTERLLVKGIDLTNTVGESGLDLRDAMVRFGQGRVADSIVQSCLWMLESIVGGVSDGAGQGVAVVGQAMLPRIRRGEE